MHLSLIIIDYLPALNQFKFVIYKINLICSINLLYCNDILFLLYFSVFLNLFNRVYFDCSRD